MRLRLWANDIELYEIIEQPDYSMVSDPATRKAWSPMDEQAMCFEGGKEVEVTAKQAARWKKVLLAYEMVQREMALEVEHAFTRGLHKE